MISKAECKAHLWRIKAEEQARLWWRRTRATLRLWWDRTGQLWGRLVRSVR
jgi:hypothetical protein